MCCGDSAMNKQATGIINIIFSAYFQGKREKGKGKRKKDKKVKGQKSKVSTLAVFLSQIENSKSNCKVAFFETNILQKPYID